MSDTLGFRGAPGARGVRGAWRWGGVAQFAADLCDAPLVPVFLGVALLCGAALIALDATGIALTLCVVALGNCLLRRWDTVTAASVAVIGVLLDWYELFGSPLRLPILGIIVAVVLVTVIYLAQSAERPWAWPPALWLWGALLALAIPAALHGAARGQSVVYYVTTFANALLMCLIGTLVARDMAQVRRLLALLAAFGTVVAAHSIVLARTGVFLLATQSVNDYLSSEANFTLTGSQATRANSFLLNPDWNGAFLALLLFLPVGLCLGSRSWWSRVLYALEAVTLLLGALFTFSLASLAAVAVGTFVFVLLVTSGWRRLLALGAPLALALLLAVALPSHVRALVSHAGDHGELTLRLGAWETALNVIRAHPLTGIGLGITSYLTRAESYRAAAQYRSLAHPHNAYLEIAALAGAPVALAFLALLGLLFARGMRALRLADARNRFALAGALVALVTLSVNSLAINGWTLAPLATIAWLMLGAVSSPLLAKQLGAAPSAQAQVASVQVAQTRRSVAAYWRAGMRLLRRQRSGAL